jgi:hypothetical protein
MYILYTQICLRINTGNSLFISGLLCMLPVNISHDKTNVFRHSDDNKEERKNSIEYVIITKVFIFMLS